MGHLGRATCIACFLARPARKRLHVPKLQSSSELTVLIYILCLGWCRRHIWAHNERMCWQIDSWSCFGCTIFVSWDISHSVLAKKDQALFAIKVELGDPVIFHSKVPEFHGFFLALAIEISLRVLVSYFKMHGICSGAQGFKCQIRALLSNLYCA